MAGNTQLSEEVRFKSATAKEISTNCCKKQKQCGLIPRAENGYHLSINRLQ